MEELAFVQDNVSVSKVSKDRTVREEFVGKSASTEGNASKRIPAPVDEDSTEIGVNTQSVHLFVTTVVDALVEINADVVRDGLDNGVRKRMKVKMQNC
jgi:hypothetical protein